MSIQIESYARQLIGALERMVPAEIFAKILTTNDDAGRHGVLIPTESYSFFPELPISDPATNATLLFCGVDAITGQEKEFGWKYYERYPERRVTRLNSVLNDQSHGRRLVVMLRCKSTEMLDRYYFDASVEECDGRFDMLVEMLFGAAAPTKPGAFVRLPIDASPFRLDEPLSDLLGRFDAVSAQEWVDSRRSGSTGIGYTFENLVGITENNDQGADFRGIELKCKLAHDKHATSGKINLFQLAPIWTTPQSGIDRLRAIGQADDTRRHSCYSQVTTTDNNLGLRLGVLPPPGGIDLYKHSLPLGAWARERLAERLKEKHSRAVFVKASSRIRSATVQYKYTELVYCERPDIQRFIDMVDARRIVFEFAMTERPPGRVRNHGYPWRLVDERELDQLFALQIKLRG
ncbi:MAG TPA: MvaI/BcnI family restriction endonuclease [Dokdonella sp.]|nr:MvaI/BcnI family restriction endonuclease [Dokdonella sp.]